MNPSTIILLTIITYFIASIPFSVLIGRIILGVDIREYGDGNPGATNVKRAGGSLYLYILAVLLDGFKGLFPVGILYWLYGWFGFEIVPIAIAALLGHCFPIYLDFKGGKAVAITGGVWVGLLMIEALLIFPTFLTYWFKVFEEDEWAVAFTLLTMLLYLLLTRPDNLPLFTIWAANAILVGYKHRYGLMKRPTIRPRKPDNS